MRRGESGVEVSTMAVLRAKRSQAASTALCRKTPSGSASNLVRVMDVGIIKSSVHLARFKLLQELFFVHAVLESFVAVDEYDRNLVGELAAEAGIGINVHFLPVELCAPR